MSSAPKLRLAVRFGELGVALGLALVTLHPGTAGATLGLAGLVASGLAWLAWIAAGDRPAPVAGALLIMAAVGGATGAVRGSGAIFVGVSAAGGAFAFELFIAVLLASPALITFTIVALAQGTFPARLATLAAVGLLGIVSGGGRRQLLQQGRQVTLIATAEQRAAVAWHEAELIAERNRLGRELHDVLAHTLGAVSIQLTALDSRVAAGDAPATVRDRIAAIHHLVGEGLGEARDAVTLLREDGLPLEGQLTRLCGLHGATFDIQGQVRALNPEATLALYRVAQEALTNAEKHAPNAPVSVHLVFDANGVGIRIDSGRSATAASSPLVRTGGGHGLGGMRERVQLAGGSMEAGPTERGWRVRADIAHQ